MNRLHPGARATHSRVVSGADTAEAMGSGDVPVLATPRLVAWMEAAAVAAIASALPEGSTTVGTRIEVRHTAPTPVGGTVAVTATLVEAAGARLTFRLEASTAGEAVATGSHDRVVVDRARFVERTN